MDMRYKINDKEFEVKKRPDYLELNAGDKVELYGMKFTVQVAGKYSLGWQDDLSDIKKPSDNNE